MRVSITSSALPEYTQRKFGSGQPKVETYVFMQGKYVPGFRADRMLDETSFRRIAEIIAPELARQQYLPTANPKDADLVIVVHWGTTKPAVSNQELAASNSSGSDSGGQLVENARRVQMEQNIAMGSPTAAASLYATNGLPADNFRQLDMDRLDELGGQIDGAQTQATNARLLGYERDLKRLSRENFATEEERTLNFDLTTERYFIILKAYDLRDKTVSGKPRRPVWTVNLNMRSPGTNFPTALGTMSMASVDFLGRTTDRVASVRPKQREGKVELGQVIILGEAK